MAGHRTIVSLLGTLGDVDHPGRPVVSRGSAARLAKRPPGPQALRQLATQSASSRRAAQAEALAEVQADRAAGVPRISFAEIKRKHG